MTTFSKNLKQAIKEKGLKQKDLGDMLGLTQQNISSYANGKTSPDIPTLRKLCEILEITPNELFGIYDFEIERKKKKRQATENAKKELSQQAQRKVNS